MNNKATKINEKGFYIWFDKNNKKEYYATPITLYRAKIVKNKDSKFSHIVFSENYQEISFRASNIATTLSTGTLA